MQVGLRENEFYDQGCRIQGSCSVQKDVSYDADRREEVAGALVEAFLQELRDGENLGLDVERQQEDCEEYHHHYSGEVVVENCDSGVICVSALSYQGRGGNAGGEEGEADHPPRHAPACKKI